MDWTAADGTPISREPPYGVAVIVSRPGPNGREYLVLHRGHRGADYAGEWAWGPPAGARAPGEPPDACARRELLEETGLALECEPTGCGGDEWAVYAAEAPSGAAVVLSAEHDSFAWLLLEEAAALCVPAHVGNQLRAVAVQRG
jgi:hypothetical protein